MHRIGPYEVLGEIARGGAGAVFRAHDPQLRRDVAIKLLGRQHPDAIRRLRREARALARLRHAHVVAVTDVGEQDGVPYLVLEYVPGETLDQRLERLGPLDPGDAAALVDKLASALEHAHAEGVIHRDLKPANVLLDAVGEPRLTDFGLAQDASAPQSQDQRLSRDGAFLGTPGYGSPEQAYGQLRELGPPTDVWGLGAVLYATLTGRPPYAVESLQALLDAMQTPPPPPSSVRPMLPAGCDALCRRCLSLDPAQRPDLRQLRVELARLRDAGAPASAPRWLGYVLAGAALVATGAGLAVLSAPAQPSPAVPSATLAGDSPLPDLREAQRALAAGDTEAATAAARRAVAADPQSAPAHLALAEALLLGGRTVEGDRVLEQATKLAPDDLAIALRRARRYEDRGERPRAVRELRRQVQLQPESAEAHAALGDVLALDQAYAAALVEYDAAARLRPERDDYLLRRAGLTMHVDLDQAERDVQTLLARSPQHVAVLIQAGLVHQLRGRLDEAVAAYQACLAREPHNAIALAHLSTIQLERGELDEARRLAERAYAARPGMPLAAAVLGDLALGAGDLERAQALLDEALAVEVRYPGAYLARANLRLKLDQPEDAERDARVALRLGAGAAGYVALGQTHLARGQDEAARAAFRNALELDPSFPEAAHGMARSYRAAEDYPQILEWTHRALRAAPRWPAALVLRAMARASLDDPEGALEDTARALELEPDHVAGAFVHASLLLEAGRVPEAIALCERMLGLEGDLGGERPSFERLLAAARGAR